MDPAKQIRIDAFEQWLINEDVPFAGKANGHFHIFDEHGKLKYQVWATTEKMNSEETGTKYVGMPMIQRVIKQGQIVEQQVHNNISEIRQKFLDTYNMNKGHMYDCILVVAVYLPTGATEIITNHYEVESKMEYYIDKYDDQFSLKTNPDVKVTGFMLV